VAGIMKYYVIDVFTEKHCCGNPAGNMLLGSMVGGGL
jgi:predicted PhzF superfamily epimerase YddE/YHI9